MTAPDRGVVAPPMHFARPEHARRYGEARTLTGDTLRLWADVIRALVPRPAVRSVLDLGAGTGRFTTLLADLYASPVVAVEPAWAMLDRRERTARADARFVAGAAESLPLRAASIDLAFLSMVYHHLGDVPAALAELRRVMRAGGWAVVRTASLRGLSSLQLLPDDVFARREPVDLFAFQAPA